MILKTLDFISKLSLDASYNDETVSWNKLYLLIQFQIEKLRLDNFIEHWIIYQCRFISPYMKINIKVLLNKIRDTQNAL